MSASKYYRGSPILAIWTVTVLTFNWICFSCEIEEILFLTEVINSSSEGCDDSESSHLDTPYKRSNLDEAHIEDTYDDQDLTQDTTCQDQTREFDETFPPKRLNFSDPQDFQSMGQVRAQEPPRFQLPRIGFGIPSFQKLVSGTQQSSSFAHPNVVFGRAPPK